MQSQLVPKYNPFFFFLYTYLPNLNFRSIKILEREREENPPGKKYLQKQLKEQKEKQEQGEEKQEKGVGEEIGRDFTNIRWNILCLSMCLSEIGGEKKESISRSSNQPTGPFLLKRT